MNNLQRILLTSGLVATASLMANSAAFAGTTATVPLSGTVPSSLTITVTPTGTASSLPLVPGTTYQLSNNNAPKIATISAASTNSAGGLKVTVTSSNKLVSGANSIPFFGIEEALTTTALTSTTGQTSTGSNVLLLTRSTVAGTAPDSSIFLAYTVAGNQAPGTYTGSLTFTATDN